MQVRVEIPTGLCLPTFEETRIKSYPDVVAAVVFIRSFRHHFRPLLFLSPYHVFLFLSFLLYIKRERIPMNKLTKDKTTTERTLVRYYPGEN